METRLFLERFDCSLYDLPGRMRVDDAILRSVAMQALHGYEAMRRHFGFFSPDFEPTNVLVRADPDCPETWCWGRLTVPSCGLLACIADFGMCRVDGPYGPTGPTGPNDLRDEGLPPFAFLDAVAALATKHGISGPFTRSVETILAEYVLYKKPYPGAGSRILRPVALSSTVSIPRIMAMLDRK
jgi:hypothetical protein